LTARRVVRTVRGMPRPESEKFPKAADPRLPDYAPPRRPATVGTADPSARKVPRGVHPETWRLASTLLVARQRLPYASAEARLIDGVQRFVQLDATSPVDGVSLAPEGPRWRAVLAVLAAIAPLVSDDSRRLFAPWIGVGVAGTPAQGAIGVSPHAGAAAAFAASAVGAVTA
jgi:hypothetical protein